MDGVGIPSGNRGSDEMILSEETLTRAGDGSSPCVAMR